METLPLVADIVEALSGRPAERPDPRIVALPVVIPEPAPWQAIDDVEARLVKAVKRDDDGSREVYADWLEEQADLPRAEWLRLQERLRYIPPTEPQFDELRRRATELGRKIDPRWRLPLEPALDIPFSVEFPRHLYRRPTSAARPAAPSRSQAQPDPVEAMVRSHLVPRPAAPENAIVVKNLSDVYASPRWMFVTSVCTGGVLAIVFLLFSLHIIG